MTKASTGLRDRKRAQTRHSLEDAAISLVLRDGLENVTIDAISERADVSPRTFFNYFDNKLDAILGVRRAAISDEDLAAYRVSHADADLAESLVGMLFAFFGPAIADPAFREARMQVLRSYPQLLGGQLARMERMTEELTEAACDVMAAHGSGGASAAVAETLLMACVGAIRAATRQWAATDMDISLDELERRAVSLVREAVERLA